MMQRDMSIKMVDDFGPEANDVHMSSYGYWVPITILLFLGCSLLEEPPPFPNTGTEDAGGGKTDGARSLDFGRRTPDAFMARPRRDVMRRLDAAVDVSAADMGSPLDSMIDVTPVSDGSAPSVSTTCQEACADQADCDEAGGFVCVDARCVVAVCVDPTLCLARLSGWRPICMDSGMCPANRGCVRVGEIGMCALLSGEPPFGVDCASEGLVAMNRARLDGTLLTVCGRAGATCRDGICGPGCTGDDDCVDSNRPRCDVGSGRCVCSADSCADNASVCGDDGRCRCAADADCTDGPVDRCVDGQCGCSSLQVCPNATTNPGTSWVCEPPPG